MSIVLCMSKLQEFLVDYDNAATKSGYQSAVYGFIKFVYNVKPSAGKNLRRTTPDDKVKYEKLIDKYLTEKRDHKVDLMGFGTSMKDRPPLSQRQTINLVNEFLACNNIVIPHGDMKRIRRKIKGGVVTSEKEFDVNTVRSILRYMDIKSRSLLLTLISSGMRIGETLQLRDSDIDLNSVPAKITIRPEYTKTQQGRITFLTPQAAEALNTWLPQRENYLASSNGKNKGLVGKNMAKERGNNGDHLFPFSLNVANLMFETAVTRAGLMTKDERTKRSQIHLHMTRKFFISQMAMVTSSKEIPETLAGHGGNMTEAYRRYPVKQLANEYAKAQHVLTIAEEQEIKAVEAEFKAKLQKHDSTLASITIENSELKKTIAEMQGRLTAMEQASTVESKVLFSLTPEQLQKLKKILQ